MNPKSHSNGLYLRGVRIDGLFGHYSYNLRLKEKDDSGPSRLLILYGNNGSGKTTILKLIFHLLSAKGKRNHRTYIARTPFRRVELDLGSDVVIVASRHKGEIVGAFDLSIQKKGKPPAKTTFEVDEEGDIPVPLSRSQQMSLQLLAEMDLPVFFLSDDRYILADSLPDENSREGYIGSFEHVTRTHFRARVDRPRRPKPIRRSRDAARMRDDLLEEAITRARDWSLQQVFQASSRGDADANAIYRDVIKRIARIAGKRSKDPEPRRLKAELLSDMKEQSQRAEQLVRYGLMAPLDEKAVVQAIENARDSALPTLKEVVTPYLESLKAKLDAMQAVLGSISTFTDIVNGFYHDKSVQFDIMEGMKIVDHGGNALSASVLSSGERQLLLLFSNVISARGNSIFIIDEPELSLNIKWQRQLIHCLLELTKTSDIQFLLATHSIPLLTRYKAYVSELAGK